MIYYPPSTALLGRLAKFESNIASELVSGKLADIVKTERF
jgi:hypothetical protein